MKRIFYILFSFVFLISCKRGNELEGIWIGSYQISHTDNEPVLSSMRLLLDISKDQIIYKTFDYPMFGEKDSIIISPYTIIENKLIFDSDTFVIKEVTEDSLILSNHSLLKEDFIFKRLPKNNKKLNLEIKNNAFSFVGPNYTDSIDFINDSLMLHIGNAFYTNSRPRHWSINSYKSFDFLVFDQIGSPPYLISNSSKNEVSLKMYFSTINDFKLTKINYEKNLSDLEGSWVSAYKNNQDLPLPPPPPNYPKNINTKLYLRIKKDSLEIEQFGRTKSKKWELNSTKEFLYFPKDLLTNKYGVWKIVKIEGDKLEIERNRRSNIPSEKEIIEFDRIINNGQQSYASKTQE
ncbi:hypothetical protein [Aureibacter tunicatorum]|uniref:Uncharacterized protein n=1 Tax=Aureibacter tunicatorum TaxID=866807 RepID=A0AAE3XQY0_9BACT|nr:hypothetical protein [Aureibacter tunicatorum]MDR6241128.1 hypothetical protein [Aureibacter tunicatorum]